MAIHHAMLDGKSVSMFLNTWAYLCKHNKNEKSLLLLPELRPSFDRSGLQDSFGLESVYLKQWEATIIPGSELNSRSLKLMPDLGVPSNLLRATFRLPREAINELKEICLVKSRGGDANRKVYYVCSVDCRSRLQPPLPQNYFGNCVAVHHMVAEAKAFMEENGVAIVAEKLSDLINGLENGLFLGAKERLVMLRGLGQEVQKFGVAGSTRLGFYGLDFGWGNVEKAEITSIDRTRGFSMMEFGDVSSGGIEIGVVLVRQEMERFASLFVNGLKALQSRLSVTSAFWGLSQPYLPLGSSPSELTLGVFSASELYRQHHLVFEAIEYSMGAFDLMLQMDIPVSETSTEHTSDAASIDDVGRATDMETSVDPLDCWHNGWDSQFCSAPISDDILFPEILEITPTQPLLYSNHSPGSGSKHCMDSCIRQGNIRNTQPNLQLLLQTMAKNMRRRIFSLELLWAGHVRQMFFNQEDAIAEYQ
ncbi:hypothetical protein POTOM_053925 [Populus tomentosa]|uniref:Uncharacterized protein n=1 Tax=Populus tomentosa TaxID=118781 RepID=A0A8X7Y2R6_POPTO|nr:hypothetical protein POTOM_053925 [Populus tomentosa]